MAGADITGITDTIKIGIALIGIGNSGTVVATIRHRIAVSVDVIVMAGANVAGIPYPILIGVFLVSVGHRRTVVTYVTNRILVAIRLVLVGVTGAVVTKITDLIVVGICLIRIVNARAIVNGVVHAVAVDIRVENRIAVRPAPVGHDVTDAGPVGPQPQTDRQKIAGGIEADCLAHLIATELGGDHESNGIKAVRHPRPLHNGSSQRYRVGG